MFPIFELEFYGCRGSTPVSGPQFVRYGGNTTCFAIHADDRLFIVDCGTGLLSLQTTLFTPGRYNAADIFLTHVHWDHIQGIPFFGPFFSPACRFAVYGEDRAGQPLQQQIDSVMTSPVFPVTPDAFRAQIGIHAVHCGETLTLGAVTVRTVRLRHPDVCTGYRFDYGGKSVCVVGDYEHGGEAPLAFARDADVLIYDAQYTDAEYPSKKGWGHSTWREGCAFAQKCGAKSLYLTHHDPWRPDEALDRMEQEAQAVFPAARFAAEGQHVKLL